MKKITLGLILLCTMHHVSAEDYSTDEYQDYYSQVNEYNQQDMLIDDVDLEYEQHVCDTAQSPKPSYMMAVLTNIGCTLFVHYIYLREKLEMCCERIKNRMNQWTNAYFYHNKKKKNHLDKMAP